MDRLLTGPVPDRTPVAEVDGTTAAGAAVTVLVVTAALDAGVRRVLRAEAAGLARRLAAVDRRLVAPLLDHGADAEGRPCLVLPRRGRPLGAAGPVSAAAVAEAAGVYGAGLAALADAGIAGPVPALFKSDVDGVGGVRLGTPVPPALASLAGFDGGHTPPEVLDGGAWTAAAQVFGCASRLWALLTGRPPYLATSTGAPPDFPRGLAPAAAVTALRAGLDTDPARRPRTVRAFTAAVVAGLVEPVRPAATAVSTPDRVFGGYLLGEPIGRGATGTVHAGTRCADGAAVAVRLLRAEFSRDPDRVRSTTAAVTGLDHPNLVRVHEVLVDRGRVGVVMDLVDGGSLRGVLDRGPLPLGEAAALLAQTAAGLAAGHAAGVVHGDLKPENVLLTGPESARTALLGDFGLATGLVRTPDVAAPEVRRGDRPGTAADVYALGATAYEVLVGQPPTAAPGPARPDGMAGSVWELVASCLHEHPEHRPTAREATRRWAAYTDRAALVDVPLPRRASDPVERPRRPPPAAPAAPVPRESAPPGRRLPLAAWLRWWRSR
ncbi:serine/threonine-protein kinase [Actinokineospora spheciospongiae]|uniref:serine/threonine-protein kinase n=1 Tax=Actinokineospora spheciospongiae TaxID=909613 RepID=UPI000D719878|nr:serine/threonine-protein kinase [Actinokineospora spheciospongiae]PWW59536.1 serine/threonine-protein kinase [Actinokineospora spheciospongiae]